MKYTSAERACCDFLQPPGVFFLICSALDALATITTHALSAASLPRLAAVRNITRKNGIPRVIAVCFLSFFSYALLSDKLLREFSSECVSCLSARTGN